MRSRHVLRVGAACVAGLAASSALAGGQANNDVVAVKKNSGPSQIDVLANDNPGSAGSRLSVVSVTPPSHGTLTIAPGGLGVIYTPAAGYVGPDSFQYSATNAVQVFSVPRQTIATSPGPGGSTTSIFDGYGSASAPVPGAPNDFYTITDRGPNVAAPTPPFGANDKIFPMPNFTPTIARFHISNGVVTQVASAISMRDASGNLRSGRIPAAGAGGTGEVGYDVNLNPLATDATGIDSEGIVALADGTFWISDEYGPFLVHFDANGNTIEQITPFSTNAQGHKLPSVLATRLANKGMEGLAITASGERLVGCMQNSLIDGVSTADGGKSTVDRIVTFDLVTDSGRGYVAGTTHQYLYLLDNPTNGSPTGGVSEILCVPGSETDFYVDERDGKFPYDTSIGNGGTGGAASTLKRVYRISLTGATDVSDPLDSAAGMLFGGKTPEQITDKVQETTSATNLSNAGVVAIGRYNGTTNNSKTLLVDLNAELANIDPGNTSLRRTYYAHDKVEGLAALDGGRRIVFSNDDDFGVTDDGAGHVIPKVVPGGATDFTQFLSVDLNNLPATTTTALVQVTVAPYAPAGQLLVTRDVYTGDASTVTVGQTLPGGGVATANGTYPNVFNNVAPDSSFGVTAPIFIDRYAVSGTTETLAGNLPIPTSQMVASFSSKSEGALILSTDRQYVTMMGYTAPVNALDVSNSNVPNHVDATNPDAQTFRRAVAQIPSAGTGVVQVTAVDAFSGDNGRAAILDSVHGQFFMAGNSNNGSGTPDNIVNDGGIQLVAVGGGPTATVVGQHLGTTGASNGSQYGFSVTQLGFSADKSGKDNNFRGIAIFGNTLYTAKGSGSNGIDTIYRVGVAGTLPTAATAATTVFTVLPGFPTALAKNNAGALNQFDFWFADANTLYVADEGDGSTSTAATNPNAGLQKWALQSGTWVKVYTLQSGLGLGQAYSVEGLATQAVTAGLRHVTGQVNGDGTVSLYATTSTVGGMVEAGANPNRMVEITDTLSYTTAVQASGEQFTTLRTAEFGEVLRGVCFVQQFATGDVGHHGGAPTSADVTMLQRIALGTLAMPLGTTTAELDLNRDGVVDSKDSVLLMYFILGRIPYLPYP